MIYLTTDWHIGHKNIIKFCNRPENHEELLWKHFDSLEKHSSLAREDTVIALGDMFWGDKKENLERWSQYRFRKILIRGNHEEHDCSWYLQYYDWCCTQMKFMYQGQRIVFSHEPIKVNDMEVNICGHLHNLSLERMMQYAGDVTYNNVTDKHIIISVERLNYMPISLEAALKAKRGIWS